MDNEDLRNKHFDALKSKYKVNKSISFDFLYLILRKAELGIKITNLEAQWLVNNNFIQPLEIIKLQQYQSEDQKRLEDEFLQLKNKCRIPKEIEISISNPISSILWKLDTGITITASDIKILKENKLIETIKLIQDAANFSNLKTSYKANKYLNIYPDNPLYAALKKISAKQQLSESEIDYIVENDLGETWDIYQNQEKQRQEQTEFVKLKSKYKVESYPESSVNGNLYPILKKLDAQKNLEDVEYRWLKQRNLNQLIEVDRISKEKKLVAKLQKIYKIDQNTVLDASSYLFFILLKLEFSSELKGNIKYQDTKFQVSEQDIHYLVEQGLPETALIAEKIHFRLLQLKYQILGQLKKQPFYEIMLKLEREERLDPKQVIQLIEEELLAPDGKIAIAHRRLEAIFYEKEYQRTGNKWNLASASSNWRKANQPEQALRVTEDISWNKIKDLDLKSALLVTRGATFRDLGQSPQAETCASQAMKLQPNTHQPYTLMGAICYDRGDYPDGDNWFVMAEQRGAKPEDIDDEIKKIVRMTKDTIKRREVSEYLITKDKIRYEWAKAFIDM